MSVSKADNKPKSHKSTSSDSPKSDKSTSSNSASKAKTQETASSPTSSSPASKPNKIQQSLKTDSFEAAKSLAGKPNLSSPTPKALATPKAGETPVATPTPPAPTTPPVTATPQPPTPAQPTIEPQPVPTPTPPVPSGPQVSVDASGRTVVDLGPGNNTATVSQSPDGHMHITSDGQTVELTEQQAQRVTIVGGDGNDTITVTNSVVTDLRVEGGKGHDTLRGSERNDVLVGGEGDDVIQGGGGSDTLIGKEGNDNISGGDGDDYIEGGAGNDNLSGQDGRDVLYGLDGNDNLSGGDGQDYLDGSKGDDNLSGNGGNDVLMGGRDNDSLSGGDGDDVLAGGVGTNSVEGGEGLDTTYHVPEGTQPGSSITVSGDPDFQARVESDLEALRSTPAGREMLYALDNSGRTTTIVQTDEGNAAGPSNGDDADLRPDGTPGPGTDSTVWYNPSRTSLGGEDWMTRPPLVGLFHELVHAYNFNTGTWPNGEVVQPNGTVVNNGEREAVGLPYDHDGDQLPDAGVPAPDHPTENQLRDELGLPTRPRY
ncbi:MAG: alkaline phosphatase [Myxococcaceae bacterium]|nr:alkaline phosphatase [Myxococcaceae bacterium]